MNERNDIDDISYTYVYRPKNRIIKLIILFLGMCVPILIVFSILKDGLETLFSENNIGSILIGAIIIFIWLIMLLNFISLISKITINNSGSIYRTFFLQLKNIKWVDVEEIFIHKKNDSSSNNILYCFTVCSKKSRNSSWSIYINKNDDFSELLNVLDFYVKKYDIKICFMDSEFNFRTKLKDIPKNLDFSN